jgi:hypothetical protein
MAQNISSLNNVTKLDQFFYQTNVNLVFLLQSNDFNPSQFLSKRLIEWQQR